VLYLERAANTHYLGSVIGRANITHDNLHVPVRLRQPTLNRFRYKMRVVVAENND
jgi:hypothetical protein